MAEACLADSCLYQTKSRSLSIGVGMGGYRGERRRCEYSRAVYLGVIVSVPCTDGKLKNVPKLEKNLSQVQHSYLL